MVGCRSVIVFSDWETLVKVINGPSDPGFSDGVRVKKGGLLGPFDICHFSGELSEI